MNSAVADIRIDPKFQQLIPPLSPQEFSQLEANIVADGCRDPLVLWGNILIDGHNRYAICKKHGIAFKVIERSFADRADVRIWIRWNQLGRRNLSDDQRAMQVAALVDELAEKGKRERTKAASESCRKNKSSVSDTAADTEPKEKADNRKSVSKKARVSERKTKKAQRVRRANPKLAAKVESGEITLQAAIREVVKAEQAPKAKAATASLPIGEFNLICADPPWRYDFSETETRAIENQYTSQDVDEICKANVPAATNCALFLWATAPKLLEAIRVMKAWGFEYKTHAIWDKQTMGMGYWFRGRHELLLVGVRGKFSPPAAEARIASVLSYPKGKHSSKPDEIYDALRNMFPHARRLEMYARGKRDGWETWGAES